VLCALPIVAQNVPYSPTTLVLTATDVQQAVVAAGSPSTLLSFAVEGDATGDNSIDVVTGNPAMVVSLILPSGFEVTAANASSLGFSFATSPPGTNDSAEIPSFLSLPGTHTTIQIPGGQRLPG